MTDDAVLQFYKRYKNIDDDALIDIIVNKDLIPEAEDAVRQLIKERKIDEAEITTKLSAKQLANVY